MVQEEFSDTHTYTQRGYGGYNIDQRLLVTAQSVTKYEAVSHIGEFTLYGQLWGDRTKLAHMMTYEV